jgi:hypothetical protein
MAREQLVKAGTWSIRLGLKILLTGSSSRTLDVCNYYNIIIIHNYEPKGLKG